jgi:archaellum biogenesis ATPase FlaH
MGGVYVSITRPHEYILNAMDDSGIPSTNLFFIDCISLMAGKQQEKLDNVVYVENPSSLEEVSMYLDRMLSKVGRERKFLFLDSLSSLLIYNTDKSVKEFTHFIINKIRLENIAGVILSIEKKEVEELVKTLNPMCDTEIRF